MVQTRISAQVTDAALSFVAAPERGKTVTAGTDPALLIFLQWELKVKVSLILSNGKREEQQQSDCLIYLQQRHTAVLENAASATCAGICACPIRPPS